MNKLTQIRNTLERNSCITVVNAPERNEICSRDPLGGERFVHSVTFLVAPKSGLYTAKELQELMTSLIPHGLEPSRKDDFINSFIGGIRLGRLFFEEVIGTETTIREAVLTDKDMLQAEGFVDGKQKFATVSDIRRQIRIHVFPDIEFATQQQNRFDISNRELKKYRGTRSRGILNGLIRVLS